MSVDSAAQECENCYRDSRCLDQPCPLNHSTGDANPALRGRAFARRDKYVVAIANAILRLASRRYRATLKATVIGGLEAAVRDIESRTTTVRISPVGPNPAPLPPVECEDGLCGFCVECRTDAA